MKQFVFQAGNVFTIFCANSTNHQAVYDGDSLDTIFEAIATFQVDGWSITYDAEGDKVINALCPVCSCKTTRIIADKLPDYPWWD